jgi:hypothetical protein
VAEEERRRSRRRKSAAGIGRKAGFLAYFGPDFLLSQVINRASIYRWWKRIILSTQGKFHPLIQMGRIPTVGSK